MKILHTGDWHLGKQLYGHSRIDEQRAVLSQLSDAVATHRPDALLICGDVFDTTTPPLAAKQLYNETLLRLRQVSPSTAIIVIAGNHDSKGMLEVDGTVWQAVGITVLGNVERTEEGAVDLRRHIVPILSADGAEVGVVVAVPHIYDNGYPELPGAPEGAARRSHFFAALADEVRACYDERLPRVLMAHLALTDSDSRGHRVRRDALSGTDIIGGLDCVDRAELGSDYDYIALGHIHREQQWRSGHTTIRYSGSPLAYTFDEGGAHSLSLVTVDRGEEPVVQRIELQPPVPLATLPDEPLPFREALAAAVAQMPDRRSYLRLHVLANEPLPPNHNVEIAQQLDASLWTYCTMLQRSLLPDEADAPLSPSDAEQPMALPDALQLATDYYQQLYGPMPPSLVAKLQQAFALANEADAPL
ncbi:MAG: exonuclease subunit SbcD [Bacteroidales bacterium]|nr:exonuclease subunit SbcD [Bacteroidales bacterium]